MPRNPVSLLVDPQTDPLIRQLAEQGRDCPFYGRRKYVHQMEDLAAACDDYPTLEKLARAGGPMYLTFAAQEVLRRGDRADLAPQIRDLVDTLKIAFDLHPEPQGAAR